MERWRHRCKGQGVNGRNERRLGWLKDKGLMAIQRQITRGHVNTFGPGLEVMVTKEMKDSKDSINLLYYFSKKVDFC